MNDIYNDLYISIVVYKNTIEEISILLDSFAHTQCKVFIIDNSPTEKLSAIEKSYPFVSYIFNNKNLGYGSAHNIAIEKSIKAKKKYHIVINPDIIISNGVIAELIEFMNIHNEVGLCMPNIVYDNKERQHLCKLLPKPSDLIFRRFVPSKKWRDKHSNKFELQNADYTKSFYAPSLSGCFMFLRTETLLKTGGFDERFFMYCEDIDLCRRINLYSKTTYVPTSTVIHHYNKESYRSFKLLFMHIKSAIQYFNKWGWIFDKERKEINNKTLKQIEKWNYK